MRKTFFTLLLTWSVTACSTKEFTEVVNETNRTQKATSINYDFVISPETVKGDFRTFLQGVVATYDKVLIKDGTYEIALVDGDGVRPKNGCTITFEPNAKIKVKPNNLEVYCVIDLRHRKNITLINPTLEGDKYTHLGKTGQWGYGINVAHCSDIIIKNAHVSKFWGDGINLRNCSNVKIYAPYLTDNRRQGMSIESCNNVDIYDLIVENTGGQTPGYGIDIEPNRNGENVVGLRIHKPIFRNNGINTYPAGFCLSTHMVGKVLAPEKKEFTPTYFEIELINPTFYGDALFISNPSDLAHGKLLVKNPVFREAKKNAIYFFNHQSANLKTEIINPIIHNSVQESQKSIYYTPILFYCTASRTKKTTGTENVVIRDAKIIADHNAKYKTYAIRNITPSTFTNDMKNVSIENITIEGYETPFFNHSGNSDLNIKQRLASFSDLSKTLTINVNSKQSKLPSLKSGTEISKTLDNTLINFKENSNNPIIYLTDDIPISGFELYYVNNSVNKVPLKLIFGTKTSSAKKMVQKTGETQRPSSGITIPYGAYVTLVKKGANSWEIIKTKSSSNVTY